ncbi:MAG: GNAT family N-acetyltransferase [Hyphomicrobiaceae bacterium]
MTNPLDQNLTVTSLSGTDIQAVLSDLAQLRMTVFREWPYLYDGSLEYEEKYLDTFTRAGGAVCVVARDADTIIGAANAAPLIEHGDDFGAPFKDAGYDISKIFYCAESVLLPEYRGLGLGHAFFDHREAHAEKLGGFTHSTFCRVIRPDNHPLKPDSYRPLDTFWRKRGYEPANGIVATYDWKDIETDGETTKSMQFWIKPLDETAP